MFELKLNLNTSVRRTFCITSLLLLLVKVDASVVSVAAESCGLSLCVTKKYLTFLLAVPVSLIVNHIVKLCWCAELALLSNGQMELMLMITASP